ncbi:MAG TPA: CGNR zinc finger domain-containing protein [Chloroflexota bacterium]|jgi:predicted RNA-binding Zn ribbon-like protein|nr:CGNR zinc finger domain-containing protein [Chloroflexota bacterium]
MRDCEYEFELSGGIACLDFANTISDRNLPVQREHLNRYEDLIAFARQAGLVSDELAERLRDEAAARPEEAEATRRRAIALREALFRLFAAVAADQAPPPDDLAHLNREMSAALEQLRVGRRDGGRSGLHPGVPDPAAEPRPGTQPQDRVPGRRTGGGTRHPAPDRRPGGLPGTRAFGWMWDGSASRLDAPLWPLARQAAELLVAPERERVRECAAGDCHWLFLDTSKNRSRRWCDMKSCGNRAKVRSFYRRKRATRAG